MGEEGRGYDQKCLYCVCNISISGGGGQNLGKPAYIILARSLRQGRQGEQDLQGKQERQQKSRRGSQNSQGRQCTQDRQGREGRQGMTQDIVSSRDTFKFCC